MLRRNDGDKPFYEHLFIIFREVLAYVSIYLLYAVHLTVRYGYSVRVLI